jgi:hypothetical protein
MKKLFYFMPLAALALGIASCEETPTNPGDFNLEATLELGDVVTGVSGNTYALTVARTADTTYQHAYTVTDTLLNADGSYQIDENGHFVTETSTKYYGTKTAKLVEMEPITLASIADTLSLSVISNARWLADVPDAGGKTQWYFNHNSTTAGGGDATFQFRTTRNRNATRPITMMQTFLTSDSSKIIIVPFKQLGEKDSK